MESVLNPHNFVCMYTKQRCIEEVYKTSRITENVLYPHISGPSRANRPSYVQTTEPVVINPPH